MIFVSNWWRVVKHAWSIRLIIIAGVLTGAETLVPELPAYFDISPRLFAAINFAVVSAAFVARLLAQSKVSDDGK